MKPALPDGRPAVMGILNVTPDSFSDGGLFYSHSAAIDHGRRMIDEGADWIDVGGESTRPGADPVSAEEERERVVPVVEALFPHIRVSIDTRKAAVARAAIAAGASLVNDVTAASDPEMLDVVSSQQVGICLMHMQGEPQTMQADPHYTDVVAEVTEYLSVRARSALEAGLGESSIWIDPGIGFGKTVQHNLDLIKNTHQFVAIGYPVLIGLSRKSTLAKIVQSSAPEMADRDDAGLALQAICQWQGARIFRVHEVLRTRRAVEALAALMA